MDKQIEEIEQLFTEFIPLYHKKLSLIFRKDDEDMEYKCNKNQKRAILLIRKERGVILSELGRYLDLRKGSLTSLIDSLERAGLVERRLDKQDRRKTKLFLTAAGEEYYQQIMLQSKRTYYKLFSKLPKEEIEKCRNGLKDVVSVLKIL
ncbi:MAG: MarR family transcriptional regulator [Firmicutes bacterium]|nr:MarR family transcriptional regulator [Bacillota bacterium]